MERHLWVHVHVDGTSPAVPAALGHWQPLLRLQGQAQIGSEIPGVGVWYLQSISGVESH